MRWRLLYGAGATPCDMSSPSLCRHAAGAGRLRDAAAAYEAAGDALAAVRAALAADPGKGSVAAAAMALRMRSPAACAAVVRHCQAAGEHAVRSCFWGLSKTIPYIPSYWGS